MTFLPRSESFRTLHAAAHPGFAEAYTTAAALVERSGVAVIDHAIVLGSGWSQVAENPQLGELVAEIAVTDLPGCPTATAIAGHRGTLRLMRHPSGAMLLLIGARTHLYEGHGPVACAHWVRVAAAWGCRTLVLTNGCGGTRPEWEPGTAVVIEDHINLTGTSPLCGPNFVDLSDVYSRRLRTMVLAHHQLPTGVYAQFPGPHYETPAEVRMAACAGADMVGMSTALEAIAAAQLGVEVLGLSLVTNAAAGISAEPLSHQEVMAAGQAAGPRLAALLADILRLLSTDGGRP